MTYYCAVLLTKEVDGIHWNETFGDHDKECVDFEVQCWREDYTFTRNGSRICRKEFPRVPTAAQVKDWVDAQIIRWEDGQ